MTEPSWMKGPPRKILLATDLSARCDRALDRAASLADGWQVPLVVLHVLEPIDNFLTSNVQRPLPSWRRPPGATRIAEEQLRNDMGKAAASMSVIVKEGEPTDVILRTAAEQGCDLIVTGIARDETLGRFGLGATVDRLLRRSKVPVLIVKKRARSAYKNIIVASDFSESSRHALNAALRIFPRQKISIFHAFGMPHSTMASDLAAYEKECRKAAAGEGAAFLATLEVPEEQKRRLGLLVECGQPDQMVHEYARDRGVDLVVLGTHGRSALFDAFLGSTAKSILSSLSCDALVVREPRAAVEGEARA